MKYFLTIPVLLIGFLICAFLANFSSQAADDTVSLSTTINEAMAFSISSGDTLTFEAFAPGTPRCSSAGAVASVTTNAESGYALGLSDGSNTNSSMVHDTDEAVFIPDYAGTIAEPTTWTGTGLGITMYAADTTKEAKWGTGSTLCDTTNNKYAGIPAANTAAHTVATYGASADTSTWGFRVDVLSTQKTGDYAGDVTFTATGTL